jgi:MscS family membrane protein
VGHFCRYGDKLGTVEDIGVRSTRIRTLDRTVVNIPNGQFSSMEIENFGRRDKIFFHPGLNLRRDTTPDQVRTLITGFREILLANLKVDPSPAVSGSLGLARTPST